MPPGPVPERIQARWSHLCQHIGERRAGSAGERAAAEYILDQFRQAHLEAVHAEPFPCTAVGKALTGKRPGKGSCRVSWNARQEGSKRGVGLGGNARAGGAPLPTGATG